MIGGLLFRYWDSGRRVTPVPPDDGLPGGLENTARNVRVKWLTKQTEGEPVALRVQPGRAVAQATANSPATRPSYAQALAATAQARGFSARPQIVPRALAARAALARGTGSATQPDAGLPPDLRATARPAGRRVSQRERNRAAAEAAIRLMFGD